MSDSKINCPHCRYSFSVPTKHLVENKRAFCGNCCKAFDVESDDIADSREQEFLDMFERMKKKVETETETDVKEPTPTEEAPKEEKKKTREEPDFDTDYLYFKLSEL